VASAKAVMRRFGEHAPTVFVIGTKQKVCIQIPFGDTHIQRVNILAQAGVKLAKTRDIGDIEAVFFVSEAWMSPPRTPMVMPSEDPNRLEVLMLNGLEVGTDQQTLEAYACKRDKDHAVIDLKPVVMPKEATEVSGPLLPAFVAGYRLVRSMSK
jgi:hypothetical protein